jgi:transposase
VRHIGLDLAKRSFTVCYLEEDDNYSVRTFINSGDGIAAFQAELKSDDRVALEAGLNSYFFYDVLKPVVAEVVVVSPGQFAVITHSKKKTDRNDAIALARFLKLGWLPTVEVPDKRIRELRQLFGARELLVKTSRSLKNMGHAVLARNGLTGSKADFATHVGRQRLAHRTDVPPTERTILDIALRQIEVLEGELDALEKNIVKLGRDLSGLRRLLQVRGFGLIAGIGVLVEIGDIKRFESAKRLVSYAGLATAVYQSGGTELHGHITKQGRKRLRGFMVEAVLSMLRNPAERNPLADFYQRKKKEKGAGKAIVASARKLLTMIYVLLAKDLEYWFLEERLYQKKLKALQLVA